MIGTCAFAAGQPTTKIRKARSFAGRSRISERNTIGLGVWVKVANPAECSAAPILERNNA
jgi:hypothetical protein